MWRAEEYSLTTDTSHYIFTLRFVLTAVKRHTELDTCPNKLKVTQWHTGNHRCIAVFKLIPVPSITYTHITMLLVTEQLLKFFDLAFLSLIQCPLLASHCLRSYSPTELHVLYCVKTLFVPPFSFLGHSFNILAPQKWLAEKTTNCSKVVTIVKRPLEQETALHSPPPTKIFLL